MKQRQSVDFILKCYQRYANKTWYNKYHFGNLMKRLSYLEEEEQELILELTDRFQFHINLNSLIIISKKHIFLNMFFYFFIT